MCTCTHAQCNQSWEFPRRLPVLCGGGGGCWGFFFKGKYCLSRDETLLPPETQKHEQVLEYERGVLERAVFKRTKKNKKI